MQPKTIPQALEALNAEQVMEALQCCRKTLWNWEQSKVLVPTRIGRKVLYHRDTIEKILNPQL